MLLEVSVGAVRSNCRRGYETGFEMSRRIHELDKPRLVTEEVLANDQEFGGLMVDDGQAGLLEAVPEVEAMSVEITKSNQDEPPTDNTMHVVDSSPTTSSGASSSLPMLLGGSASGASTSSSSTAGQIGSAASLSSSGAGTLDVKFPTASSRKLNSVSLNPVSAKASAIAGESPDTTRSLVSVPVGGSAKVADCANLPVHALIDQLTAGRKRGKPGTVGATPDKRVTSQFRSGSSRAGNKNHAPIAAVEKGPAKPKERAKSAGVNGYCTKL